MPSMRPNWPVREPISSVVPSKMTVTFVNHGDKAFVPPRRIPDSGNMTDDK